MIDPTILLTYIAIVTGFVFVPGPAIALTVARSTSAGTRVGLATALGIGVGGLIHTAFAVIGLSALILGSAVLFTLVKVLGAAYLVYLGLRAILTRDRSETRDPVRVAPRVAFRQAILAEVLNPKTALFFVAFLPQFVAPERGAVPLQLAVFGALLVILGLAATTFYAVTAGGLGSWLRSSATFRRWQNRVTGSIYCAVGLRLALQER